MTMPSKGPKKEEDPSMKESFFEFIQHHKWDAFAYLVLFLGLLVTAIFDRFFGGLLVGLILGIYFSQDLREKVELFKEYLDEHGIFRSFVLIAGGIAMFMASPGLCIGTGLGAFVRPYLGEKVSSPFDKE